MQFTQKGFAGQKEEIELLTIVVAEYGNKSIGNKYIRWNPEDTEHRKRRTDFIMNSTLHLLGSKNKFQIQF